MTRLHLPSAVFLSKELPILDAIGGSAAAAFQMVGPVPGQKRDSSICLGWDGSASFVARPDSWLRAPDATIGLGPPAQFY